MISAYFDKLLDDGAQACLKNQGIDEKYYSNSSYKSFVDGCSEYHSYLNFYKYESKKIIDSLYLDNKSDFIIVNMIDPSDYRSTRVNKSTITFTRKRDGKSIYKITNTYKFNEVKRKDEIIRKADFTNEDFDGRFVDIEKRFYSSKEQVPLNSDLRKDDNPCYVIVRENGKYTFKYAYY